MKLNDIDKTLNEAPVGLLGRAATKLKKHTPFAPGIRAQAEGQDEVEAAANAVALTFRKWLGRNTTIKNKNEIPYTELLKFFNAVNMGKTGKAIMDSNQKVQDALKGRQEDDKPGQTMHQKPAGMSDEEWAEIKKAYNVESLEARLNKMLVEDDVDPQVDMTNSQAPVVNFSKDDVEEIILDVVGSIQSENPDGLADWLEDKGVMADTPNVKDQTTTVSDEDFELIQQRIEELVQDIENLPSKVGMDPEKKKKYLQLLQDLGQDAIDDLG